MAEGSSSSERGSIGFCGLLAILFIGLKLGGVIDWSWWWVLAPIWVPFALIVVVFIVGVGMVAAWDAFERGRR
jgi:hypothetical protein